MWSVGAEQFEVLGTMIDLCICKMLVAEKKFYTRKKKIGKTFFSVF